MPSGPKAVTLVFIRHARSCSNLLRGAGLDDPHLTAAGTRAAQKYGPRLRRQLAARGVHLGEAFIGSSGLARARETAELLFPGRRVATLPHIRKDDPQVPRDATALLAHLYTLPQKTFIIVAHKGFIRKNLMAAIGAPTRTAFDNLDTVVIKASLSQGNVRDADISFLDFRGATPRRDECSRADRIKMRKPTPFATRRKAKPRRATRRRRVLADYRS